jgi:hypothetical protein
MKALPTALVLAALARAAHAQPPPETPAPKTEAPPAPAAPAPTTALAAIDGAIEASPAERLQALRLLGIGLHLTGRPTGAEAAFLELLRARPKARLDPTTTRPEVVAFFEDVRRRHAAEIQEASRARSRRSAVWNFLPPVGQFKNGDPGRGAVFLTLEVAAAATAITTKGLLTGWCGEHNLCGSHTETAKTARAVNYISVGVLAATYAAGVIDAFVRSDREPDDERVSLFLFPGGAGLTGRF